MKFRVSLIIKIMILVTVTFGGVLFFLFSHNLETIKKSSLESEREKARIILQTLMPIVSIAQSFEFESSIDEHIKELKRHNEDIIDIKIEQDAVHKLEMGEHNNYIIEHIDIPDYFDPYKKRGVITIIYSNSHYHQLVGEHKKDILYTAIAVSLVLILMTFLLYYAFLPLKKLARAVNAFDFKKTDIPVCNTTVKDEVSDISNALTDLLSRVSMYAKELSDLNMHLQERVDEQTKELLEFNETLKERIEEAVEKIRAQDKEMIRQSRHAAMGEMIDSIAHQWKQPLSALSVQIQDIKDAYEFNELDKKYVDNSVKNSMQYISNMSEIIDDFRNFFRPEKLKKSFSMKSSVEYALRMSQNITKTSIGISIEGDDMDVYGYKNELSQVIINIINNAKDAFEERGINENAKIVARIKRREKMCILEIEDNAGGIPQGVIDRIFDQYFTTKSDEKGTGIGLYLSKTIIEDSMDGTLEVKNSKEPGGASTGAIFTIAVPCADVEKP